MCCLISRCLEIFKKTFLLVSNSIHYFWRNISCDFHSFKFITVCYGYQGGKVERGIHRETGIDTYTLLCVKFKRPLEARRSNQSFLKEIRPGCSLEGLMLKLKPQYFGHLIQRTDSLEKTPMLGKIEGRRRVDRGRDGWIASLILWTWIWASSGSWWWTGKSGMLQSMGLQRVGHV